MFPLHTRLVARAALPGLLSCIFWTNSVAQSGVLFAIPTESHPTQPLAPNAPWRIALEARDLPALARTLNVAVPTADANALEYTLDSYPELSGNTGRTWLESTFVIDYQERDVAKLHEAFIRVAGDHWARRQLVDFVSGEMTPSLEHGFEIASQVARTRNGDCKAYAVLTAALARSTGVPARVVLGLALLEYDGRYATYGHAWAEIRERHHWLVADATAKEFPGVVRYLPLGILEDEGPGFQMAITRLTPVWIQRVVVLGAVPTD